MAQLDDYHTALDAFHATPSETTLRSVLVERAKLPDAVSGDGVSASLPNGSTLESMLRAALNATTRTDNRRFIRTGVSHGSS